MPQINFHINISFNGHLYRNESYEYIIIYTSNQVHTLNVYIFNFVRDFICLGGVTCLNKLSFCFNKKKIVHIKIKIVMNLETQHQMSIYL